MRGTTLLAQARATALTSTTLTVPYPTPATALTPNVPGLSAGSVRPRSGCRWGARDLQLMGSAAFTVVDTWPQRGA